MYLDCPGKKSMPIDLKKDHIDTNHELQMPRYAIFTYPKAINQIMNFHP
jgi:hypothetical protein